MRNFASCSSGGRNKNEGKSGNGNLLDTVAVDATNPYNPFGFTLKQGTYAFIGRRLVEGGPRPNAGAALS